MNNSFTTIKARVDQSKTVSSTQAEIAQKKIDAKRVTNILSLKDEDASNTITKSQRKTISLANEVSIQIKNVLNTEADIELAITTSTVAYNDIQDIITSAEALHALKSKQDLALSTTEAETKEVTDDFKQRAKDTKKQWVADDKSFEVRIVDNKANRDNRRESNDASHDYNRTTSAKHRLDEHETSVRQLRTRLSEQTQSLEFARDQTEANLTFREEKVEDMQSALDNQAENIKDEIKKANDKSASETNADIKNEKAIVESQNDNTRKTLELRMKYLSDSLDNAKTRKESLNTQLGNAITEGNALAKQAVQPQSNGASNE
jgi:hypothetical protein